MGNYNIHNKTDFNLEETKNKVENQNLNMVQGTKKDIVKDDPSNGYLGNVESAKESIFVEYGKYFLSIGAFFIVLFLLFLVNYLLSK